VKANVCVGNSLTGRGGGRRHCTKVLKLPEQKQMGHMSLKKNPCFCKYFQGKKGDVENKRDGYRHKDEYGHIYIFIK
jgi:hypothetical protein